MQVKVFEDYSITLLEEKINHWINENHDITVVDIKLDNSQSNIMGYIIYTKDDK